MAKHHPPYRRRCLAYHWGAKGKSIVFEEMSFAPLPPRVYLTGHVPDDFLPFLYAGAIASPYLSVYEGFGLPPLEAMACGTPAITGNLTALPEVVGDAAILVDPFQVDEIARAMTQVITNHDLRIELGRRGIQRAKRFDWSHTANQTWNVLEKRLFHDPPCHHPRLAHHLCRCRSRSRADVDAVSEGRSMGIVYDFFFPRDICFW